MKTITATLPGPDNFTATLTSGIPIPGPPGPPGASITIMNQGVALPVEQLINFVGAGVTAADNPTLGRIDVTIPANQTPWLSNIDAGQFKLTNIPEIDFSGFTRSGSVFVNSVGFQVAAGAGTALYLSASNQVELISNLVYLNTTGMTSGIAFQLVTNGSSNALIATAPGNIGIGQANPAYPLDVNGDCGVRGLLHNSGIPQYASLAAAQAALGTGTKILWYDTSNVVHVT